MRRNLFLPALLVIGVACGSDGGDSGDNGSADTATTTVVGLLGLVPDTEGNRTQPLYYGNLDLLRAGDTPASLEDDVTLLIERSSNSVYLPRAVSGGIVQPEFREFTGFDTREIGAYLDFGSEKEQVSVIVGRIDAGDLESGLRSSPGGDGLTQESIDGVTYLSLGVDDEIDFEAVSPVRRLGEPVRIAVDGPVLYWSRDRALVDACVAAAGDTSASLADDPAYSAVGAALDASGVVAAHVLPPWSDEAWTVAGLGETFQDATSTVTIALHYSDASAATAAVDAFRAHVETGISVNGAPWSETLTIIDIRVDGSTMIATLTSQSHGVAFEIHFRQENLLQF